MWDGAHKEGVRPPKDDSAHVTYSSMHSISINAELHVFMVHPS